LGGSPGIGLGLIFLFFDSRWRWKHGLPTFLHPAFPAQFFRQRVPTIGTDIATAPESILQSIGRAISMGLVETGERAAKTAVLIAASEGSNCAASVRRAGEARSGSKAARSVPETEQSFGLLGRAQAD
jgi:hypothetical protein